MPIADLIEKTRLAENIVDTQKPRSGNMHRPLFPDLVEEFFGRNRRDQLAKSGHYGHAGVFFGVNRRSRRLRDERYAHP